MNEVCAQLSAKIPFDDVVFYQTKHLKQFRFYNGSTISVVVVVENGFCKGKRIHNLLVDDCIDKKIVKEVCQPMLGVYITQPTFTYFSGGKND